MDIKEKIDELTKKVIKDPETRELFQKDPIQAVEQIVGKALPDDEITNIVNEVKSKSAGAVDSIKGLFGK